MSRATAKHHPLRSKLEALVPVNDFIEMDGGCILHIKNLLMDEYCGRKRFIIDFKGFYPWICLPDKGVSSREDRIQIGPGRFDIKEAAQLALDWWEENAYNSWASKEELLRDRPRWDVAIEAVINS